MPHTIMIINITHHTAEFILSAAFNIHSNGEQGACAMSIADKPEQHGKGQIEFVTVYAVLHFDGFMQECSNPSVCCNAVAVALQ